MVPKGWKRRALGDCVSEVVRRNGNRLPVLTVSKDLGIVLQTEKFGRILASDDRTRYKRVRRGEFAYDPMLLWDGSIARQDRVDEGVVSPAYFVFQVDGACADSDFMEQFLTAHRMKCVFRAISEGTNERRRKARFEDFGRLSFPMPPLPEQRKIAAVLSGIDDAVAATRKVIEQTKRVKRALLQTLMTRGIRHTRFKKTEIGEIPESWEVHSIASLVLRGDAGLQTGPFGTVLKAEEYSQEGVPLISVGEIRVGRVEIRDETPRVGPEVVARLPQCVLVTGDIVFARKGGVDRSALITERESGWFLGSDGIRLRLNGGIVPAFASLYLQMPAVRRWLEAHATGTTMATLSQKVLNRLLLPEPSRAEQVGIVERLGAVDESLQSAQAQAAALSLFKKGLTQDLLTGRVRVQTD